jgi:FtsP/CotA-like multicopper oxidase with cupredoxin domain
MAPVSRRDLLRTGAGFVAGMAASALFGGRREPGSGPPSAPPAGRAESYGHGVEPPTELAAGALDSSLYPPAPRAGPAGAAVQADLWVSEQPVQVARDARFDAWTFNGAIPGPVLRAREGDALAIRLRNLGARPHNLHLHGCHDVAQDGWQPVPPGGTATYRVRAEPFGLHPYHCDAAPAAEHLSHGLYGLLIVDPPRNRPPAHEVALVLSGFDLDGDGKNELYGWNGVAGFFERFPIKVPTGALVRVYLLNMVPDDPVASFHLHAEMFDVYRSGTRLAPDERTDVVTLAQTERAIVEFRLPRRGRYMFHPHQRHMAERGAMGWFAAV